MGAYKGLGAAAVPEGGPVESQFPRELANERHRQAHDGMRITLDRGDERRPETVDGECSGNLQGFAGRDVGVDLVVAQIVSEGNARRRGRTGGCPTNATPVVDHPVSRMQVARASAHEVPAFPRYLRPVGLAVDDSVELEQRIAAHDHPVDGFAVHLGASDSLGLGASEHEHGLIDRQRPCGRRDGILIDPRRQQHRLNSGRAQGREPSGRGGGEVQTHGDSYARGMGEWAGKTIELDVTNIAHGGVSVARHEGRVVFVADAIPGERVLARVSEDSKKSFWRAETVAIVEPSEFRQPHVWGAASIDRDPAERAGGAEFGHIQLAHQRELKRQVLTDSLQRMAGFTTDVTVEPIAGDDERDGTGWRTRVRLHVAEGGEVGPYAARSHRVIDVTDLPLATHELEEVAPLSQRFAGHEHVDVLSPSTGGARLIIGKQKPTVITEVVGEREFRLSDHGFWQVHHGAAQTLTSAVQQAIDPALFDPSAHNLDLYGGVGLLAAAVGDQFGPATKITTVESDSIATDFAAGNLAEWIGAHAETGRVERWAATLATSASASERERLARATVILDPPRSGAGRDVVDAIARLDPAQIVYVACDPVAFARDVALFAERGYALRALRAFDLFPNTHHVEAVGTLSRN